MFLFQKSTNIIQTETMPLLTFTQNKEASYKLSERDSHIFYLAELKVRGSESNKSVSKAYTLQMVSPEKESNIKISDGFTNTELEGKLDMKNCTKMIGYDRFTNKQVTLIVVNANATIELPGGEKQIFERGTVLVMGENKDSPSVYTLYKPPISPKDKEDNIITPYYGNVDNRGNISKGSKKIPLEVFSNAINLTQQIIDNNKNGFGAGIGNKVQIAETNIKNFSLSPESTAYKNSVILMPEGESWNTYYLLSWSDRNKDQGIIQEKKGQPMYFKSINQTEVVAPVDVKKAPGSK